MTTLYEVANVILSAAQANAMVATVTYGDPQKVNAEKDGQYPHVHVAPDAGSFETNSFNYGLQVTVVDLPLNDNSDRLEVDSKTLSILNDLYAALENGIGNDSELQLQLSSPVAPVVADFQDRVYGWQVSVNILVPNSYNACDLPI